MSNLHGRGLGGGGLCRRAGLVSHFTGKHLAWLAMSLVACGGDLETTELPEPEAPTSVRGATATVPRTDDVVIRDSSGVVIVETLGSSARAPAAVRVDVRPTMELGRGGAADRAAFGDISGLAILPNRHVVVLDGSSAELLTYDLAGSLVENRAGFGLRPGMFRRPELVQRAAGDSLLVFDRIGRRFTVYPETGDGFRAYTGELGGGRVAAAHEARVLLVRSDIAPILERGLGVATSGRYVRLLDLWDGSETMLATLTRQTIQIPPRSQGGAQLVVDRPYGFEPVAAVGNRGLLLTTPREPSVLEYSWTGRLLRIFRLRELPTTVTNATFERALDDTAERLAGESSWWARRRVRRALGELDRPLFEPTFSALVVDSQGWLWARAFRYGSEDEQTWLLFDSDGKGRGSATTPSDLSVLAIGGDLLAGTMKGLEGEQLVRLHRVIRW